MAIDVSADIQSRIRAMGLLDPTGCRESAPRRAAYSLDSMVGKKAGFLDNRKGNADVILERVREVLEVEHGVSSSVARAKWVFSAPASFEILGELAQCDFVVTAIGD